MLKVNTTCGDPNTVEKSPLKEVDNFTHLVSVVDEKGGRASDMKAMIGKVRTAFSTLTRYGKTATFQAKQR